MSPIDLLKHAKVVKAYLNGEAIECLYPGPGEEWEAITEPIFYKHVSYRVKRVQHKRTVFLSFYEGGVVSTNTKPPHPQPLNVIAIKEVEVEFYEGEGL